MIKQINKNLYLIQDQNHMCNNSFIISNDLNETYIIDPSWNYREIQKIINDNNLNLKGIILTHLHYDHIGDINPFIKTYNNIPIYCSKDGKCELDSNNSMLFATWKTNGRNINYKFIDEKFKFDNFDIKIVKVPGHSECSIILIFNKQYFIVGDLVFENSIGRFDFPFSNQQKMIKSLIKFIDTIKKYKNPIILPGHDNYFKIEKNHWIIKYVNELKKQSNL